MRIGVIGTGRIGTIHANTLSRHREVGSLILTDAEPSRAQELALRLGETAAPGVDEIFRWGVDAVVITASTSAHAELIGRAARSGLPVFCEKPIALDLAGTLQAIAEVEAAGTVLQMGFQRRFDAGYTGAREAVSSGRLGRLHTVRAVTSDQSPPPAAWLPVSGGLFRDSLIHDFDVLRWVTGREVTDVYAAGSDAGPAMFRAAGDVDTAAALLTLDDGTLATATATRLNGAGYDVRMELAGELDQIVVGLDDRTPIASTEPTGPPAADKPWTSFLERFGPAYEAELNAFVDVIRGTRPNPCDGREALQALRIAEACDISRRERRAVSLAEVPGGTPLGGTAPGTAAPGTADAGGAVPGGNVPSGSATPWAPGVRDTSGPAGMQDTSGPTGVQDTSGAQDVSGAGGPGMPGAPGVPGTLGAPGHPGTLGAPEAPEAPSLPGPQPWPTAPDTHATPGAPPPNAQPSSGPPDPAVPPGPQPWPTTPDTMITPGTPPPYGQPALDPPGPQPWPTAPDTRAVPGAPPPGMPGEAVPIVPEAPAVPIVPGVQAWPGGMPETAQVMPAVPGAPGEPGTPGTVEEPDPSAPPAPPGPQPWPGPPEAQPAPGGVGPYEYPGYG